MAFVLKNLGVLAYTQGFTLWLYKTTADDVPTIQQTKNYFRNAADMLTKGDMIVVAALDGGCIYRVAEIGLEHVVIGPLY